MLSAAQTLTFFSFFRVGAVVYACVFFLMLGNTCEGLTSLFPRAWLKSENSISIIAGGACTHPKTSIVAVQTGYRAEGGLGLEGLYDRHSFHYL